MSIDAERQLAELVSRLEGCPRPQCHVCRENAQRADDVRAALRVGAAAIKEVERLEEAEAALRYMLEFGVEMDDARLDYIVAQIDRAAIEQARAYFAAREDT